MLTAESSLQQAEAINRTAYCHIQQHNVLHSQRHKNLIFHAFLKDSLLEGVMLWLSQPLGYISLDDMMKGELERKQGEVVVEWQLPARIEENHNTLQSEQPVSRLRFKPSTLRLQVQNFGLDSPTLWGMISKCEFMQIIAVSDECNIRSVSPLPPYNRKQMSLHVSPIKVRLLPSA
jgi:hypothetical protein